MTGQHLKYEFRCPDCGRLVKYNPKRKIQEACTCGRKLTLKEIEKIKIQQVSMTFDKR
jgi:transcription initiation factor IIE alpha subunit